ncbi:MAG TPA: DNA double-strand break repair nuclease NurA [Pyrinomonadaceae bacterium]|nr:DNA double-strand break repair nuclease NurA [Pyrinomonadaceae bacterium]
MLYRELLTSELHKQREDFQHYVKEQASDLSYYLYVLRRLEKTPSAEILSKIGSNDNAGAIPADELDARKTFSFAFDQSWGNHEQARGWAAEILKNRTTFAADGSQIYAEKDISLPVGAIQIGWFENPHDSSQHYEKNAYFELLSPKDLLENQDEPMNPETRVGERRFHAEVAKVAEFLQRKRGWQQRGERMPLAFFDNTLLISFSLPQTQIQESFLQAAVNLVRLSRDCEVPLIGYIDRSFSRDLLHLLDAFEGKLSFDKQTLYDATILYSSTPEFPQTLKNWGDRTCFCYSRRKGLSAFIDPQTEKSLVGFVYLQTTSDSAPARLDIPSWVFEEGLLDEVLNVVRAECIIGLGYPYALETADQTAVITSRDREIFLRALQEFATREKLNFSVSRKNASKGRRR